MEIKKNIQQTYKAGRAKHIKPKDVAKDKSIKIS